MHARSITAYTMSEIIPNTSEHAARQPKALSRRNDAIEARTNCQLCASAMTTASLTRMSLLLTRRHTRKTTAAGGHCRGTMAEARADALKTLAPRAAARPICNVGMG